MRVGEFETILGGEGVTVSRAALDSAYDASGAYLSRIWSANRDVPVEEHVRAILAAADPTLPARVGPALLGQLTDAYARPALVVPPTVDDGALGALQSLRAQGYRLGVVSNTMRTPGRVLRKLLAHYGLLDCFIVTTFSDEVGVRKPDPDIFTLTLRALGGEPETAVHVGDDAILDVQGARAARMRVIQVSSAARPAAEGGSPDAVIARLAALPAAVAALEER